MSTLLPTSSTFCHRSNCPCSQPKETQNLRCVINIKANAVVPKQKAVLWQKIWSVASSVLNTTLGLFLYWANSSIFAFSFFIGIIKDDEVGSAIQKIKDVWDTQPFNTCLIGGFGSLLGGAGIFFSLPMTAAVGTIIYSANLGCSMSRKAQEILNQKHKAALLEKLD